MSKNFIFIVATGCFLVSVSGCATSTGIIPMGPDTYTITAESEFGSGGAKKKALSEANKFAEDAGKYMIPVNVNTGGEYDPVGDYHNTYELTFRLVTKNDPEYRRTNLQKTPDIVIQKEETVRGKIRNDITIDSTSRQKSDMYTELMKLNDLKERGIITKREFDKEKRDCHI